MIANHIALYCHATDEGDAGEIADFFWDDAWFDFEGRFTGRAEIEAAFADWIERRRAPVDGLRHLAYLPAITFLGDDDARASTYFDADGRLKKDGRPIRIRGRYRDRLTRRHGRWRFAEKTIDIIGAKDPGRETKA